MLCPTICARRVLPETPSRAARLSAARAATPSAAWPHLGFAASPSCSPAASAKRATLPLENREPCGQHWACRKEPATRMQLATSSNFLMGPDMSCQPGRRRRRRQSRAQRGRRTSARHPSDRQSRPAHCASRSARLLAADLPACQAFALHQKAMHQGSTT